MKTKIHVVGAGFAGLTLALKLAEKGHPVALYEKSDRVGGLLGTEKTEHGIAEKAANALIRSESSVALFESLNIPQSTPLPTAKKRFIFRWNKPRAWPLNVFETLGFAGKVIFRLIRKGKDGFKPDAQQDLNQWGLKHLGPSPTRYLLEPAMQGIYGNPLNGLSASLILGSMFKKSAKSKRYGGLLTGPGGMQDLIDHLRSRLLELKVEIQLNQNIDISKFSGPVVLACSSKNAAEILKMQEPEKAALLNEIPQSSLLTATLFFKKPQDQYKGFGCLIPHGLGYQTLGILMNSYIFKDRDQVYNETWILGGLDQEELMRQSDADILKLIAQERFAVLKTKEGLTDYRITRWPRALPYYGLKLESILKKLAEIPETDIYLHGNYLGGIGLTKILDRSIELAEKISRKYG